MTLFELLMQRVATDASRPLVTYRNVATGERMELSAITLANGVAKTAGLLRDDLDVQPGDSVAVDLPLHWQGSVWAGACSAVQAICCPGAREGRVGASVADGVDALRTEDRVAVSLAPFGLPTGAVLAPGVIDASIDMRAHPDVFVPFDTPDDTLPAVRAGGHTFTERGALDEARRIAAECGLTSGGRLLICDHTWSPDVAGWLSLLAVPLVADAAVVLVGGVQDATTVAWGDIEVAEAISARLPTNADGAADAAIDPGN